MTKSVSNSLDVPRLVSGGIELNTNPQAFGILRDSSTIVDSTEALRARMQQDGYLFLRGYLNRDDVLAARREVTRRLADQGCLDEASDPIDAVARKDYTGKFKPELARKNAALENVLYNGALLNFFERFLDGSVRHFDYTWLRAVSPGRGTSSHCDCVYMSRGTQNLFTAWTPLGDISYEMGGLIVLEGSHRNERLRNTYGKTDVDSYCTNREGRASQDAWAKGTSGVLSKNPVQIQKSLGGRWLTTEYRAGDVLIFSIFTVHASLDNHSDRVRLSSDSRYQLASDPVDERWVGTQPIGHSQAGKRGRIC
ncbi:MAG TPA: phytanoyl-CoA dioxygenase family protein [Tepidisphaeraceae bacterium]|jgi:hypothetical protein|nr:phytanoyl-CoA dioxygenase family protein [Tepidisphaeraceae bacterium]